MLEYVARRIMAGFLVVLGISIVVFGLMHWLPGDPVALMLWEAGGDEATVAKLRDQLGLNDPVWVQFGRFLAGLARGDLGTSIRTSRPVVQEIRESLPSTLQLTLAALFLSAVSGISLGIIMAINHNRWIDHLAMVLSLVGVSMPIFWSGLLLIMVFSVRLGWLPVVTGGEGLRGLIMPALALAFAPAALISRLVRSSMLEILHHEYVMSARAKGLHERTVLVRHALRNALIPVITVLALEVGSLLGGMVVTETVFTRPGIGSLMIKGIRSHDFPVVQGVVLFTSVAYVLVNLVADLLYGLTDPRMRTQA